MHSDVIVNYSQDRIVYNGKCGTRLLAKIGEGLYNL